MTLAKPVNGPSSLDSPLPILLEDKQEYSSTNQSPAIKQFDVNNDGILDLVSDVTIKFFDKENALNGKQFDVALGKGDGTFLPPKTSLIGEGRSFFLNGRYNVWMTDINADGYPDAIASSNYLGLPRGFVVMLNNKDGTFGKNVSYDFNASQIDATDTNGDGTIDIVAKDDDGNIVTFFNEKDSPKIISAEAVPSDANSGSVVGANQEVNFTFKTDVPVTVTGLPYLELSDDDYAYYDAQHSTSTSLSFFHSTNGYVSTPDLAVIGAAFGSRYGDTNIVDANGKTLDFSGFVVNPDGILRVDAVYPTITSVVASPSDATLMPGDKATLTLTASEEVIVNTAGGTPTLNLSNGGVATYDASASTGTALVFDYTVLAGQPSDDLGLQVSQENEVTAIIHLNGGTITDTAKNELSLLVDTLNPAGVLQISGSAPTSNGDTGIPPQGGGSSDGGNTSPTGGAGDSGGGTTDTGSKPPVALPAPVNGVSVTGLSSADFAALIGTSTAPQFISGTELVSLVDGQFSVGPNTNVALLQRLYVGLLGHTADSGGIGYWQAQLDAGARVQDVAAAIMTTPAYAASATSAAGGDLGGFVGSLYQSLLGRAATGDETSYWVNAYGGGNSPQAQAQIAVDLAGSDEAKTHLAADTARVWAPNPNATLVNDVFETGLGRTVELDGVQFWTRALTSPGLGGQGLTPAMLADAVAGSSEFASLHASQGDSDYIGSIYQEGLGRAADADGAAFWASSLQSGAVTRAGMLLYVAQSTEAAAHLQGAL